MSYIDLLKQIKAMIKAKDGDDDPMFYMGGVNVGGIKMGSMNYGGINMGGIALDGGDEHEFEREEICDFIIGEIENLKLGQTLSAGEKSSRLLRVQSDKSGLERELSETPGYRFIKKGKIKSQLEQKNTEFRQAQLLHDMKTIDPKHISLLGQISEILMEQQGDKNKYKRKAIRKYIDYAIYRIESQEKSISPDIELSGHSLFERIKITGEQINKGVYGEKARDVIQEWGSGVR